MPISKFELFEFQEAAAQKLTAAAMTWLQTMERTGSVLRHGRVPIPFLGQLRAITGSGKSPILARTIAGLGPCVILWTTRSSVVVQQTIRNLNMKYRHLLPTDTTILREMPTPSEWRDLFRARKGTTIWVVTVASWNDAEAAKTKGKGDARLNLHRPQHDWGGPQSPWDQLRDENQRRRPLWIVYDESHGQTGIQLDQLVHLRPKGLFAASATPVVSKLFGEFRRIVEMDSDFAPAFTAGDVHVRTADVARAGLLKSTIKIDDRDQDPEDVMEAAATLHANLEQLTKRKRLAVTPKTLWVVEESNPKRGSHEEARPVAIWRYLTERRRVAPEAIAICTDTRELPKNAEKIQALESLLPRHRNIIFNQALQEGWDDPEAYIAYFDGATRSATRIKQVIGRVLRQPHAQKFDAPELNTAYLFIKCSNERFDEIVEELREQLKADYDLNDAGEPNVRVETRKESIPAIPPRSNLRAVTLPVWVLGKANLDDMVRKLTADGARPFATKDLEAPGQHTWKTIQLDRDDARIIGNAEAIGLNARVQNGEYLLRQIRIMNRGARHALDTGALDGPMYSQLACVGSLAQARVAEAAASYVSEFEARITYDRDPNPSKAAWRPSEHRPLSRDRIRFKRAVHREYAGNGFNKDELPFARALDATGSGFWMRNPAVPGIGYGIPLPRPVGSSGTFFPDFLWWIDNRCFALDTTGKHLLDEKVRGKLLALKRPEVAFVVRGKVTKDFSRSEGDGWTLVRPNSFGRAEPSQFDDLADLLAQLLGRSRGATSRGAAPKARPADGQRRQSGKRSVPGQKRRARRVAVRVRLQDDK